MRISLSVLTLLLSINTLHSQTDTASGSKTGHDKKSFNTQTYSTDIYSGKAPAGFITNYDETESSEEGPFDGCMTMAAVIITIGDILFGPVPSEDTLYWKTGFSDYPYFNLNSGEFCPYSERLKAYSYTLSYLAGNSGKTGINFKGRVSLYPLFGFDTRSTAFFENGRNIAGSYSLYMNYTRIKMERFSFRWGLGALFINQYKFHPGWTVNAGMDIYPFYPVSLTMDADLGFVRKTRAYGFSALVNFHINRSVISAGYRCFNEGRKTFNSVNIGFGLNL